MTVKDTQKFMGGMSLVPYQVQPIIVTKKPVIVLVATSLTHRAKDSLRVWAPGILR